MCLYKTLCCKLVLQLQHQRLLWQVSWIQHRPSLPSSINGYLLPPMPPVKNCPSTSPNWEIPLPSISQIDLHSVLVEWRTPRSVLCMREGLNGVQGSCCFLPIQFPLDITVLAAAPFSFLCILIAINVLTMVLLIKAQFESLLFHNDHIDNDYWGWVCSSWKSFFSFNFTHPDSSQGRSSTFSSTSTIGTNRKPSSKQKHYQCWYHLLPQLDVYYLHPSHHHPP